MQQLLEWIITPYALTLLFLVATAIANRQQVWPRRFAIAAVLIMYVGGHPQVNGRLAQFLEWQYLPQPIEDIPAADVILPLGGGADLALWPNPHVQVNSHSNRYVYAALLYQAGKAERIIVSGRPNELKATTQILQWMGVPDDAILRGDPVQDTHGEALEVNALQSEFGFDSIILITSARHMPRAVATFAKQDVVVTPAPTAYAMVDCTVTERCNNVIWDDWLLPDPRNFTAIAQTLREYAAWTYYWLRGWV